MIKFLLLSYRLLGSFCLLLMFSSSLASHHANQFHRHPSFRRYTTHELHCRKRGEINSDHPYHHGKQNFHHSRSENSKRLDRPLPHYNNHHDKPKSHDQSSIAVQMDKSQWSKFFDNLMKSFHITAPDSSFSNCLAGVFEKSESDSCSESSGGGCVVCHKSVLKFIGTNYRDIDKACGTFIDNPTYDNFDDVMDCAVFDFVDNSCLRKTKTTNNQLKEGCIKEVNAIRPIWTWFSAVCPNTPPDSLVEIAERYLANYLRQYIKKLDEKKVIDVSRCLLDKDRIFSFTWVAIIENHLFGKSRGSIKTYHLLDESPLEKWVDHIKQAFGKTSVCSSLLTDEINDWFISTVPDQGSTNDLKEELADKEIARKIVERILTEAKMKDSSKNQKISECLVTGQGEGGLPFTTARLAITSELGHTYITDAMGPGTISSTWLPEWEAIFIKQLSSECAKTLLSSTEKSSVVNIITTMKGVEVTKQWPDIWRFHSKK